MSACFNLGAIEQLLIYIVILIAVITIVRIVVPWVLSLVGGVDDRIMQVINVVLWAVVVIVVIRFAFTLLSCLFR